MAHIGSRDDMSNLYELSVAMAKCGAGRPAAEVAQAALDLAFGLWRASGGVTREMALEVVTSQVESMFQDRSN